MKDINNEALLKVVSPLCSKCKDERIEHDRKVVVAFHDRVPPENRVERVAETRAETQQNR